MNPTANTLPNPKMRKFESTGLKLQWWRVSVSWSTRPA